MIHIFMLPFLPYTVKHWRFYFLNDSYIHCTAFINIFNKRNRHNCKCHNLCIFYIFFIFIYFKKFKFKNKIADGCLPDDDSWKFFEDRCYFISDDELTWWNAQIFCNQNGGHLVSIHNEYTNNFIKGQVGRMR